MYYISLVIAVTSGIFYHITQKSISDEVNPIISLIVTYIVALAVTLVIYYFDKERASFVSEMTNLNWASFALGVAIVGLELGILLAYRAGWDIGKLGLFNNILVAMILIPIGLAFFKEHANLKTIIGILVSLSGLVIIKM